MAYVINTMANTTEYWMLVKKTKFHHCIAQYVTKMVKFKQSQIIRRDLYGILGDPYSQDKFNTCSDAELIKCGLSEEQIATLRYISSLINESEDLETNLQRLSQVRGVGPWTLKSIRLMLSDDTHIFLYEDSYIRTRLAELYGVTSLSQSQAKNIALAWCEYQSYLSKFLWRIKKSGITKIKLQMPLLKEDFL
jgi:3-methyladenine DNA glycosylase/8-oxoguanine DNA glycosylase